MARPLRIEFPDAIYHVTSCGDGRISVKELLSAAQLNWMDANHDGRIDASDPGFAALRLWVDANGDADSKTPQGQDETSSLSATGISAIDLKAPGGPTLIRADGTTQALTEQSLSGGVLGVASQAFNGQGSLSLAATQQKHQMQHLLSVTTPAPPYPTPYALNSPTR